MKALVEIVLIWGVVLALILAAFLLNFWLIHRIDILVGVNATRAIIAVGALMATIWIFGHKGTKAFGNTALFVSKWFQKGSLILVTGSIQTRKYIDKQGNNRTAAEIMANKVDFCGGKSDSKPADRAQDAPQNYSQGNTDDFSVIDDSSDLPFN